MIKLPTEFKLFLAGLAMAYLMFATGCSTAWVNDSTTQTTTTIEPKFGTPVTVVDNHDVTVVRGTVLVASKVDTAKIQYGPVRVDIGGYATAGDAAMVGALGTAITSGVIAFSTYGTSEAVQMAVTASLMESLDSVKTNAPSLKQE